MKKGFTLLELIITMAIIVALAIVVLPNFLGIPARGSTLISITEEMVSVLRTTQTESIDEAAATTWGVHFENSTSSGPFYATFSGNTYASSSNQTPYPLGGGVGYVSSSLPYGSSFDVVFSAVTGMASATTIQLCVLVNPSISSTITIGTTGLITESLPM